jgi:hypothetical protein
LLFVSLPQRWWRVALTRTEEKRLEPDAVFIEYFEHFKKKIKKLVHVIYLFLFITDITWVSYNIGL